jgi:hypothetical protein
MPGSPGAADCSSARAAAFSQSRSDFCRDRCSDNSSRAASLAGVDPFVMEIRLSQVREAMPMMRIVATRPELLPIIALPVVLGFIAALYAIWQTRGIVRTRWIILAALIGVGLVTAFWQIRVFSSAAPLAALPASYVVLALTDRLARSVSAIARAFITALLCLPLSSVTYALALPHDDTSHAATLAWAVAASAGAARNIASWPRAGADRLGVAHNFGYQA